MCNPRPVQEQRWKSTRQTCCITGMSPPLLLPSSDHPRLILANSFPKIELLVPFQVQFGERQKYFLVVFGVLVIPT